MFENNTSKFRFNLIFDQINSIILTFMFIPLPLVFILSIANTIVNSNMKLFEYNIETFIFLFVPIIVVLVMIINILKCFLNIIWLNIFGKNIKEKEFKILNRSINFKNSNNSNSGSYKIRIKYKIIKNNIAVEKIKNFPINRKYLNDDSCNFILLEYGFFNSLNFRNKNDSNANSIISTLMIILIFIFEIFYIIKPILNIIIK